MLMIRFYRDLYPIGWEIIPVVDQNTYSDLAGNGNIKSSPFIWRYDDLAPAQILNVTSRKIIYGIGDKIDITMKFNKLVAVIDHQLAMAT